MTRRLALAAIGAFGFAAQIVLLRELMVSFSGNELTAGLMVGVWILLEALGALAGTRLRPDFAFAATLSLIATLAAVPLALLSPGWFGLLPAQIPDILTLLTITSLVTLPPAFTHGLLFTLGARSLSRTRAANTAPANAYLWEGLGTALSAALISFWLLSRLSSISLLALFGLPMAIGALLLSRHRPAGIAISMPALLCCLLLLGGGAQKVERWTYSRVWRGQQVTGVYNSPYGRVLLLTDENQTTLFANGSPVFTSLPSDIAGAEELIHIPLLLHPLPRTLLIIGPAFNGPLHAAVRHPLERIVVLELDPVLTRLMLSLGAGTTAADLANNRTQIITADPRVWLAATPDSFDCIIITEPAPLSLSANRLFTAEFYRLCRQRLTSRGILAGPGPGGSNRLSEDAAAALATRVRTLTRVFPEVRLVFADMPLILASDAALGDIAGTAAGRIQARGLNTAVLDSAYLAALLDPFRQEQLRRWLPSSVAPVNTDLHPVELRLSMTRTGRLSSPFIAGIYRRLGDRPAALVIACLLLLLAGSILLSMRGRASIQSYGIFTTGFTGAALSTLLIYTYAVRFGSVYSQVALLVGAFMAGNVAGALLGSSLPSVRELWLFAAEITLVLLAAAVPLLGSSDAAATFPLVAGTAGAAVGLQYVATSRLFTAEDPARVAGRLYTLDLTGGALGGLLTALIVTPVWGITGTAVLLLMVKGSGILGRSFVRRGQAVRG